MFYIYKTTNLINGKKYIGQHKKSVLPDDGYLGSGVIIKQAIRKYGKTSFKKEIITIAMSQFEADVLEKYYISKENPEYNILSGGQGKDRDPWNKGKHSYIPLNKRLKTTTKR